MNKTRLLLVFGFILTFCAFAQESDSNSMSQTEVKTNASNRSKCKPLKADVLEKFASDLYYQKSIAVLDSLETALKLWKETNNLECAASTYAIIGAVYNEKSDYAKALENYQKSLSLFESINNEAQMAEILFSEGLVYRYMLNYGDAMESNIKSLQLGQKLKDTTIITQALLANGFNYMFVGQFSEAIKNQEKALQLFLQQKDSAGIGTVYNDLGVTHLENNNLDEALKNHKLALDIRKKIGEPTHISISYAYISETYKYMGNYTEALKNSVSALKYAKLGNTVWFMHSNYIDIGNLNILLNDFETAFENFTIANNLGKTADNKKLQAKALSGLGRVLIKKDQPNKAILRFKEAASVAEPNDFAILNAIYKELSEVYIKKGDYKNAYEYQLKFEQVKDSMYAAEKAEKITNLTQNLIFENKRALQKASQDKQLSMQKSEIKQQKLVRNITAGVLILAVIFALILFKRFTEKRKLNVALQSSLNELKTAQNQLIQAEKMANLGELTAGISHEIQNPLNFVNNFAEVSSELIDEMHEELEKGNMEDVKAISTDLKQNLKKINNHGKRADSIVKGMLQHSRNNSGEKESTDLNKLTDEFLRLAYHGLRAKDKSFNATLDTDFDPNLGKITIVSQDIGRVILNLFTNAFYAVSEKHANTTLSDYKPTVSVKTFRTNNAIKISIKDNGDGIPKNIIDKIFQPFFTTKPSGKGTGLGLSMSYDIIKAHCGELQVDSKDKEGTTFIVSLPVTDLKD